jgi:phage-related protein
MAKDIEVDININSNTEATMKNLRALKKQLRDTAAGSDEFNRISQQIRDMDDAIKDATATSDDFLGYLENASGPLGVLGKGIRGAEKTFSSFNGVLKASVIGIITLAIGGLVAAFSKSETAMKKLEPVFAAFDQILNGIMKVFEPLLDAFIDLALRALPLIAKGVGGFYSGLFALFTLVKNVGVGAGKILKGIFTLDFNALKEGYSQLTGSWNSAVEEFKESNKRFNSSSNDVTKVAKKN